MFLHYIKSNFIKIPPPKSTLVHIPEVNGAKILRSILHSWVARHIFFFPLQNETDAVNIL